MAGSDDGANSLTASSWLDLEIRPDGNSLPPAHCGAGRERSFLPSAPLWLGTVSGAVWEGVNSHFRTFSRGLFLSKVTYSESFGCFLHHQHQSMCLYGAFSVRIRAQSEQKIQNKVSLSGRNRILFKKVFVQSMKCKSTTYIFMMSRLKWSEKSSVYHSSLLQLWQR